MAKKNVVMQVDEQQLARIDEYCKKYNTSRSELLRNALYEECPYVKSPDLPVETVSAVIRVKRAEVQSVMNDNKNLREKVMNLEHANDIYKQIIEKLISGELK